MQPSRPNTTGSKARREEGAAMLVVMLMLLMVTATAAYAVHATGTELRAAGQQRLGMETHYAAQGALISAFEWVDRMGPAALVHLAAMNAANGTGSTLDVRPFEPPLASGYNPGATSGNAAMGTVSYTGLRLYVTDLSVTTGSGTGATLVSPITTPSTTPQTDPNARPVWSAHTPVVVVDVYDIYRMPGSSQPGQLANGNGNMMMMRATYTARARDRIGSTPTTTPTAAQALHEVASDARGDALSGPFGL